MWCVPRLDEAYIVAMEDVLATYERPYDARNPVVCLDEKPLVLHGEARSGSAARPGRSARRDYEYVRHGTANAFCAVEPKAGRHFAWVTPNRGGSHFAGTLFRLAMAYPEAETIHLVMDNLNIHRQKALVDCFGEEMGAELWSCFTVHHTPKHASWLNQAEIEISLYARQCLGKRRIPDLKTVRRETAAWLRGINREKIKINWNFTRKAARKLFAYQRITSRRSKD